MAATKPGVYVDTNVFLARMDKKHKNHLKAWRFLKEIRQKGTGVVSTYVIFELIWVLIYLEKSAFIPTVLDKVFKTNVRILSVNEDTLRKFKQSFEPVHDVKDYLHYMIMAAHGIDMIATFNQDHFKSFKVKLHAFV
ncbi:MAG: type II toxin-antitoxin system VapC family toxin [Candidatus Lokiarchaeota archaeon]|nr:type II toxin-antitoxin system VapC family toxin [Candidatus Lokiarchaeota archaeon]